MTTKYQNNTITKNQQSWVTNISNNRPPN